MKISLLTLLLLLLAVQTASTESYYALDNNIVGWIGKYEVRKGESLIEIARKFDLGYNAISGANPGVDPFIPPAGLKVIIPMMWIIPDVPVRRGIVINISEMRLYFFLGNGTNLVTTFPIGVGDEGTETPEGNFRIIAKIVRPSWYVPKSIRKERPELPTVIHPGPDNPLGSHALRLSVPAVLIHGTNKPWAVGRRATHGCLRLYPEDIPRLFLLVNKGDRVTIVRQPVKAGTRGNKVFIEVHPDGKVNYLREALKALGGRNLLDRFDGEKLKRALEEKSGVPEDITAEGASEQMFSERKEPEDR